MKKFNQMTEVQMSKANGGAVLSAMAALIITIVGIGTGAGLGAASNK